MSAGWVIAGLVPLVLVWAVAAVLFVRERRRRPPRVAVLESRGPREAVRRAMERDR